MRVAGVVAADTCAVGASEDSETVARSAVDPVAGDRPSRFDVDRLDLDAVILVAMPRPAVNKEAARDLGTRIAKARKLKEAGGGPVATDRVAAEVYAITGVYVSRSTI